MKKWPTPAMLFNFSALFHQGALKGPSLIERCTGATRGGELCHHLPHVQCDCWTVAAISHSGTGSHRKVVGCVCPSADVWTLQM